jgi:hypothetical protein
MRTVRTRAVAGRVALIAALLAVMLRVLVPGGFMAAPAGTAAAAGLMPIMLCTDAGLAKAFVTPDGQIVEAGAADDQGHDDPSHNGDAPCAFSAASATILGPLAEQPSITTPLLRRPANDGQRRLPSPGLGLAAPSPPATAPPLTI